MRGFAKALALVAVAAFLGALSPAIQRQQEMLNPTVQVAAMDGLGSGTVLYSGVEGTFILTNFHVISEAITEDGLLPVKVKFWTTDANGVTISSSVQMAEIIANSKTDDLALLKVRDCSFRASAVAVLARPDAPLFAGEDVYVAGAGMGHRVFLTRGLLSVIDDSAFHHPALLTSSPTINGNSGGSLWHERADGHFEMIGVPEAIASMPIDSPLKETIAVGVPTMSFAIPLKTVRSFLGASGFGVSAEPLHGDKFCSALTS